MLSTGRALTRLKPILAHLQPATMSSGSGGPSTTFPRTGIPSFKDQNIIRTAGALIIGDEILNGKVADSNSHYFAKFCFQHGIDLRRIEVVADVEEEIVEASRRMVKNYDFVITTGGIGPTHDDITYASLATAFSQPLKHDAETIRRMTALATYKGPSNEAQLAARNRMALFPANSEVIFTADDLWVPVVRLEGKLCIFPGIPQLFRKMLDSLTPYLNLPPRSDRSIRRQIRTSQPEAIIAPYLTALQQRVSQQGVRVGSYPRYKSGVTVSLIGPVSVLQQLVPEVEREIEGQVMGVDEVDVDVDAEGD